MSKTIEHFAIEEANSDIRIRATLEITTTHRARSKMTDEVRAERDTLEKKL